jgi:FMN phosphatase YigB (HAD superfamily)
MDIIFDIDGTLLNIEHRLHFLKKSPKDWKAFRDPELKDLDEPRMEVIRMAESLGSYRKPTHDPGNSVEVYTADVNCLILASARVLAESTDTLKSLSKFMDINMFERTYFRPNKDFREDIEVKSDMLDKMRTHGYDPVMAFDDRPSVIRMWRERGLVVADVGYGKEF